MRELRWVLRLVLVELALFAVVWGASGVVLVATGGTGVGGFLGLVRIGAMTVIPFNTLLVVVAAAVALNRPRTSIRRLLAAFLLPFPLAVMLWFSFFVWLQLVVLWVWLPVILLVFLAPEVPADAGRPRAADDTEYR
ncbi:hypothetical protein [Streptomyces avicenniae]|uniref:hypothetical protein n=1 Tax=Streptomyces avicenniae TaxID=500153 RepID=UPI00069C43F1|nr:hypothetical protein [Streptomyces avicenniae]